MQTPTLLLLVLLGHVTASYRSPPKTQQQPPATFVAAVYNHRAVTPSRPHKPDRDHAQAVISSNLDVYEQQIARAAEQNSNIIVFPEDGLFGVRFTREEIYHYLEHVPDPSLVSSNPCEEFNSEDAIDKPIQFRMSCAAKMHSMYVVVNMGDIQNCTTTNAVLDKSDGHTDRRQTQVSCPADGRFQYNTNIVFDPRGYLAARYHKQNLFYEFQFDLPPTVEHAILDTPFGRIGLIICFDILFRSPAIDLVETLGVRHVLFPAAWRSILPAMSGLGFHEGWAVRTGVSLLAAQYHLPEAGFSGSAVYRGALGADDFHNDYSLLSPGKLLVTETPVEPVGPSRGEVHLPEVAASEGTFQAVMEGNLYTWVLLAEKEGELYLKDQDTECYLSYRMQSGSEEELYAFGIFEGQNYDYLNSYVQVCALVRCEGLMNETCGTPTREAYSVFSHLKLSGKFSVDYIYPGVLIDNGDIDKSSWDFLLDEEHDKGEISAANMSRPLLSAILYTRDYERDNNTDFERPKVQPVQSAAVGGSKRTELLSVVLLVVGFVSLVTVVSVVVHGEKKRVSNMGHSQINPVSKA